MEIILRDRNKILEKKYFRRWSKTIKYSLLFIGICYQPLNYLYGQVEQLTIYHDSLFQTPSDPKISPDGRYIAFLVTQSDFSDNQFISHLWLADLDEDTIYPLVQDRPNIYSLDWKDHDEISFLDLDSNSHNQIFSFNLRNKKICQITNHAQSIYRYQCLPGGGKIAFFSRDSVVVKEGWERHVKSFEVGLNSYLIKEEPRPIHLWICDQDGQNAKQISRGIESYSPHYGDFCWSPDGTKIAYVSQPSAHTSAKYWSQIKIADLDTDTVITLQTKAKVWEVSFLNTQQLVYSRPRNSQMQSMSSGGLFLIDLINQDNDLDSLALDHDLFVHDNVLTDDQFVVSSADGTRTKVWLASFKAPVEELDLGDLVPYDQDIEVHTSGAMAIVSATEKKYKELYYKKSPGAAPVQLTNFNEKLSQLEQGRVESISWRSEDGTICDGVVTYPPDFSTAKEYPLVVAIHGGPASSSQVDLYFSSQLLASQGWIVFNPNYRGSNNHDEHFQTLIVGDPADGPGKDIISGIHHLINSSNIDTTRIGVMGWSYGGYLTAWLVTQYDFWKAGIMGAGISDHLDMYTLSDVHLFSSSLVDANPWEEPGKFRASSPINFTDQIKTPLMILSMANDQRVPVTNSYKMFHALRDQGVETKFILYPVGGHTPSDPAHIRDVRIKIMDWFKKHFGE